MKIAVRLDDIAPDMDWEKFDRFLKLMDQYHVKALLGVIPENRDRTVGIGEKKEDFFERMRELQARGYVIAMHGCYHLYTTEQGGLFPLNHLSEFAGLPFEKQTEMIRHGKEILEKEGIRTDIFMAPAHSYDADTLRALRENGFTGITDGFGKRPYRAFGLIFYPISDRRSKTLAGGDGISTLVVHTNTLTEEEFRSYEKIFREQDMMAYGEYMLEPAEKRGKLSAWKEYIMADIKRRLVQRKAGK